MRDNVIMCFGIFQNWLAQWMSEEMAYNVIDDLELVMFFVGIFLLMLSVGAIVALWYAEVSLTELNKKSEIRIKVATGAAIPGFGLLYMIVCLTDINVVMLIYTCGVFILMTIFGTLLILSRS